jgi:hypothetical protein
MQRETTKWEYFKWITLPKIWWNCGGAVIDYARSFWHLRVMKKKPLWTDADATKCQMLICRYCGRDTLQLERIFFWTIIVVFNGYYWLSYFT